MLSSNLYLKAREMCPDSPQSMYEQGFVLMGRPSIFLISFLTFVQSFGLIVIFFQIFGGTMAQFMTNIIWPDVPADEANFGMTKTCWVLALAVLLLPAVLMKELAELKIVSVTLFLSVIAYVIILTIQLLARGNSLSNLDVDAHYWKPVGFNAEFVQSIVIIATAFNFQTNLFPIHSHAIDKSVRGYNRGIGITMLFVWALYVVTALVGIYSYGRALDTNMLTDIGEKYGAKVYPEAYVMQAFFLVILSCHIPFCFFAGKESVLIIIDEQMRRSLSYALSRKLMEKNKQSGVAFVSDNTADNTLHVPGMEVLDQKLQESLHHDKVPASIRESMQVSPNTTTAEMTQLAYKTMNPVIYYSVNVLIYAAQAYLGIALGDIGLVFGFIGTFAGVGLCYFVPSIFFIRGYNNFATKKYQVQNAVDYKLAIANFILGFFFFGLFLYSNV